MLVEGITTNNLVWLIFGIGILTRLLYLTGLLGVFVGLIMSYFAIGLTLARLDDLDIIWFTSRSSQISTK